MARPEEAGEFANTQSRRWVTPVLLVAVTAFWLVWNLRALRLLVLPRVSLAAVLPQSLEQLTYREVRVKPPTSQILFPRGTTLGKEPHSYFAISQVGHRWLLVCQKKNVPERGYVGVLEPLAPFDENLLLPRLRERYPQREFHSVRLNTVAEWHSYSLFGVIFPSLVFIVVAWALRLSPKPPMRASRSKCEVASP